MRKRGAWIIFAVVVISALVLIYFLLKPQDLSRAIPLNIRNSASFDLYFPSKLPEGFSVKKDSIEYRGGVLFTQFSDGDHTIFLSQQSKPTNQPRLESLSGFKEFPLEIGQAVTGEQEGVSAVLINTASSTITVTGGETTPRETLGSFAKKLVVVR